MRFYVTSLVQNALFRRVRFFSPAQTSSHLTESAFYTHRLTERRSLYQAQLSSMTAHTMVFCLIER